MNNGLNEKNAQLLDKYSSHCVTKIEFVPSLKPPVTDERLKEYFALLKTLWESDLIQSHPIANNFTELCDLINKPDAQNHLNTTISFTNGTNGDQSVSANVPPDLKKRVMNTFPLALDKLESGENILTINMSLNKYLLNILPTRITFIGEVP